MMHLWDIWSLVVLRLLVLLETCFCAILCWGLGKVSHIFLIVCGKDTIFIFGPVYGDDPAGSNLRQVTVNVFTNLVGPIIIQTVKIYSCAELFF